jgi:2-oxo-4-hydroxy-4-carboxy-5-ureidoimidazoline decarboxylase
MNRKTIRAVVLLGAISLVGILFIQFFWVSKTIESQKTAIQIQRNQDSLVQLRFSEKTNLALRDVIEDLNQASDQATSNLDTASLLIAFSGHPRIGERKAHSAWSSAEQSGLSADDVRTLDDLAAANLAYEKKFDHVFLICATGKNGIEILKECNSRINNSPEVEIQEAREQLRLINQIRIKKLLEES